MPAKFEVSKTKIIATCTLAAILRYILVSSKYQTIIANHIEVSTPLNSWKRVLEGLFLLDQNVNPYSGDLLHEPPSSLLFYRILLKLFWNHSGIMFVVFDILTGVLLYVTTKKYMLELLQDQAKRQKFFAKNTEEFLLRDDDYERASHYALVTFLFNPYTIFNCIGCSTTVLHNFFLALFLWSLVNGNVIVGAAALSVCTSMSLYPVVLIIPLALYSYYNFKSTSKAILSVVLFVVNLTILFLYCSNFGKNFDFLKNVYGFILTVPDLQPNIGLFWYFFTEMFDHFRDLFICSFQINATILYLVPLSIRFRKNPFLLTAAELFLICVFKSYPSVGDVGFVLSLLPCFIHLFSYCQQRFLVSVIFLITTSLAPILWYLWIYCNSANANFYFGVTLGFAIAQIFLLTDVLFAQVKREFCLMHGKERLLNGEEAILALE